MRNKVIERKREYNVHDVRLHLRERERVVDGKRRMNVGITVVRSFVCNFHGVPDLY